MWKWAAQDSDTSLSSPSDRATYCCSNTAATFLSSYNMDLDMFSCCLLSNTLRFGPLHHPLMSSKHTQTQCIPCCCVSLVSLVQNECFLQGYVSRWSTDFQMNVNSIFLHCSKMGNVNQFNCLFCFLMMYLSIVGFSFLIISSFLASHGVISNKTFSNYSQRQPENSNILRAFLHSLKECPYFFKLPSSTLSDRSPHKICWNSQESLTVVVTGQVFIFRTMTLHFDLTLVGCFRFWSNVFFMFVFRC